MIKIRTDDSRLYIRSPYNTIFVNDAKKLGGRWRDPEWAFDLRDADAVLDLCLHVYGTDGERSDLVDLEVSFPPTGGYANTAPIIIGGRPVARAYHRDSGAKICDGVIIQSGGFRSSGSRKNWETRAEPDTVVLIRDYSRSMAEQVCSDIHEHSNFYAGGTTANRESFFAKIVEQ